MKFLSSTGKRRGTARHWLIGCGAALLVVILMLTVAGYYGMRWVKKNVSLTMFDAQTKADPPVTAAPDEVLPPAAAGYTRSALEMTTPGLQAVYTRGEETVTVMAVPTDRAQEGQVQDGRLKEMLQGQNKPEVGKGMHIRINMGPSPVDIAIWSNRNWTYLVQTTATQALPFAQEFEPAGEPGQPAEAARP